MTTIFELLSQFDSIFHSTILCYDNCELNYSMITPKKKQENFPHLISAGT